MFALNKIFKLFLMKGLLIT